MTFCIRLSGRSGKPTIQAVGKLLAVFGAVACRTTCDLSATSQFVEQVSHGQSLTDVDIGKELATRVECFAAFPDDVGGERHIGRNDEVIGSAEFDDALVGNVGASADEEAIDEL